MKNSRNKVIASLVCGIIMGSVGTSFIGKFEDTSNPIGINKSNNQSEEYAQNDNNNPILPDTNQNNEFQEGQGRPKKGQHAHHGSGSLEVTEGVDISSGKYNDGTYKGDANGYSQGLSVQVEISSGKISNIEIVSHNETPGFYEIAFEQVPNAIIQKQSTAVDTVSGATYSSVGIINAVNEALSSAQISSNSDKAQNTNLDTTQQ